MIHLLADVAEPIPAELFNWFMAIAVAIGTDVGSLEPVTVLVVEEGESG